MCTRITVIKTNAAKQHPPLGDAHLVVAYLELLEAAHQSIGQGIVVSGILVLQHAIMTPYECGLGVRKG